MALPPPLDISNSFRCPAAFVWAALLDLPSSPARAAGLMEMRERMLLEASVSDQAHYAVLLGSMHPLRLSAPPIQAVG
jgi:hypothetical protein